MFDLKVKNKQSICFLTIPAALCLYTGTAFAATYDVGNGQTYPTLDSLVTSGVLANGDVIRIHNDDASFIGQPFPYTSLTVESGSGSAVVLTQAAGTAPAKGGMFSFTPSNVTLNLANLEIRNSQAQGIDSFVSSGQGGAVYAANSLSISNASNIGFYNNTATGGNGHGSNSGAGGAIYVYNALNLSNAQNITFSGNQAIAGNASGTGNNSTAGSGQGGAIYASQLNLTDAQNITFENNRAIGGNANGLNASNSGNGGAVYIGFLGLDMTGAQNVVFRNNLAQGGAGGSATSGGNADKSGLGGAISILSASIIEGASFYNNRATTSNTGDMSSGLGGAIYNSGPSLTLIADAGKDITFSGNTHNPGATGAVPNSIYFGSVSSGALTTALTLDVADGANVNMLDPLASQADNTTGKYDSRPLGNVNLTINKNGAGTWILAGHNDMASATTWNINEGTLYLARANNSPAHIDLRNATTASFNMASGSNLLFALSATPHLINGKDITLSSGSNVGMNQGGSFSYFELPAGAEAPLLSLRASDSLSNSSTILNPEGAFSSGFYDYRYGLYWRENNALSQDLVAFIQSKTYNEETGASSATTAPSGIATQNVMSNMLSERFAWNFECFDNCRDQPLPVDNNTTQDCQDQCEKSHNVWLKPTYRYTSRDSGSNFTLKTPGIALGIDNCFDREFFLGLAIFGSWPEYRSTDADINAKSVSVALYGGTLLPGQIELGLLGAYGRTSYDQTRRVYWQSYSADYSSNNLNLGINFGRRFQLDESWMMRPFLSYEYMRLDVGSYTESWGNYALQVDSHKENFHFLRAGTSLTWTNNKDMNVSGEIYYAGLYGDNAASARAFFLMDTSGTRYESYADKLDSDALGLGINSVWHVTKDFQLAASYNFEVSKHTYSHYAGVNLIYSF